QNYLRTCRKRSGLAQHEVAFLLGCQNGGFVSRYEKRKRLPTLTTALACEAVFGVPVAELFAGLREGVGKKSGSDCWGCGRSSRIKAQEAARARSATPPGNSSGSRGVSAPK